MASTDSKPLTSCRSFAFAPCENGGGEPFTFVVDLEGVLRLAPRRSEHVACAGGRPVLSAGEVSFERGPDGWEVTSATNQSTGYCPWACAAVGASRAQAARSAATTKVNDRILKVILRLPDIIQCEIV